MPDPAAAVLLKRKSRQLMAAPSALLPWTLGGPWFREQRTMGGSLAAEWFSARDDAMRLWD